MRIDTYKPNNSAFLSVNKDMKIIIDEIFRNKTLQKLLFYTSKDAYKRPDLTDEETMGLFGKNIKNVPKLYIDDEVLNYIIINFDNFVPNASNPKFRDHIVEFDILCHFSQWELEDFDLRPYRIAAEIDFALNEKHLTGIGKLEFLGCNQMVINDEIAGLCLMYQVIHSDEDKLDQGKLIDAEKYFKH